ncbi:MAG: DUF169 domain-containing protein [Syntrophobacteraceae bacterium]
MDKQKLKDAIIRANCALKLERKIVGVKFLFSEEEFEKADGKRLKSRMPYCVMVKAAMSGKPVKARLENFGCMSSARALGVLAVDEFAASGRHYDRLGLYQDLATSKNVHKNMTMCKHQAHGVVIKPVEEFCEAPDVALIITKPYNVMRIVQGYTHIYGCQTSYKMAGNQAICSECTAYPFESNSINVSLLCSGTRHMGKWGDDEMGVGMPFNKLLPMIEGLCATVSLTESNRKKAEIEARMNAKGRSDLKIEYDRNYYTGLYVK